MIGGAGHLPHVQTPERFADTMIKALRELSLS
jgi:hypothetical protein